MNDWWATQEAAPVAPAETRATATPFTPLLGTVTDHEREALQLAASSVALGACAAIKSVLLSLQVVPDNPTLLAKLRILREWEAQLRRLSGVSDPVLYRYGEGPGEKTHGKAVRGGKRSELDQ